MHLDVYSSCQLLKNMSISKIMSILQAILYSSTPSLPPINYIDIIYSNRTVRNNCFLGVLLIYYQDKPHALYVINSETFLLTYNWLFDMSSLIWLSTFMHYIRHLNKM